MAILSDGPKEVEIQKAILDYLKANHYDVFRFPVSGVMHRDARKREFYKPNPMAGFPDLFGFFRQRRGAFAIEVKRPKNKPSRHQQWWIDKLNENLIITMVAHSAEDVQEFMFQVDKHYEFSKKG